MRVTGSTYSLHVDVDMDGVFGDLERKRDEPPASGIAGLTFTVEQLELMLAEARRREKEARECAPKAS